MRIRYIDELDLRCENPEDDNDNDYYEEKDYKTWK
jgi:hypothetical protein